MLSRWTDRVPPLAELLIVGVLFWGIICGNLASEVAGGMLDGFSWDDTLRIVARNEAMFAHRRTRSLAELDSSVESLQVGGHAVTEITADHDSSCDQCEHQLYLSLLDLDEAPI